MNKQQPVDQTPKTSANQTVLPVEAVLFAILNHGVGTTTPERRREAK